MGDLNRLLTDMLLGRSGGGLGPLGDQVVGETSEGRPVIANPDGSYSTERTATVLDPRLNQGRPTNVPTIYNGQQMGEDQAVSYLLANGMVPGSMPEGGMAVDPETGRIMQGYDSIPEATRAARLRSPSIAMNFYPPYKGF